MHSKKTPADKCLTLGEFIAWKAKIAKEAVRKVRDVAEGKQAYDLQARGEKR